MKIRVLLVEDQKIMQKYFASMVQGDERFLLVDVLTEKRLFLTVIIRWWTLS